MTENPRHGEAPRNDDGSLENTPADQGFEPGSPTVRAAGDEQRHEAESAWTQPQPPDREPFAAPQEPAPEQAGPQYLPAHNPNPQYPGQSGQHHATQHPGPQPYSQQPYSQQPYSQQQYGGQQYAASGSSFGAGYTQPRRKASFGVGTLVASILAAGLVGGGVAAVGVGNGFDGEGTPVSSAAQSETVIVNNTDSVNEITAAALKATPSVVTISATSGSSGGTGSGIILDDEGHILTNTHVVTLDGATANANLEIRTSDGRVIAATLVGTDPLSDLAVIKAKDTSGLTPAALGDSGALNVGDTVIAIGSPLGLTGTVTDGIVSTLNRTISVASAAAPENGDETEGEDGRGFQFAPPNGGTPNAASSSISINVIQTDAAINPGNSGGALVNSKGEVIGVNVAIASAGSDASSSAGNIGVGFSIPINHAKRIAQEIVDNGSATHGQLGVSVKGKTASSTASEFSVGAEVATVESGSAADKAGIKVGDIITRLNDLVVSEPNQLTAAVREQPGGAEVTVTVLRNGREQTLEVTLGTAAS